MLSIGKMVVGAESYYLGMVAQGREEYYTGAGESPGSWVGSGRHDLGLDGHVSPKDLRNLLAGIAPHDGHELGAKRSNSAGRVAGFDLTFSAPKSVSLLYGLGSSEAAATVREIHDRAVLEGLAYLEGHALSARRGAGGEHRIGTSGLVAAAFVHRTSRSGDPQLHTHVLAANVVLGADGRWSAPDARLLYFHARTAGFVYQASLRAGLVESLGVRFGPVQRGSAELAGVDRALLRGFSTRRAEIEEYLLLRGDSSRRTSELAALATRAPKSSPTDIDGNAVDLRDRWHARAFELGVDPETLSAELGDPRVVTLTAATSDQLVAALLGPDGLTAQESVFERRDVVRAIAERLAEGSHLADIEMMADRVLGEPQVALLAGTGRGGEPIHTTHGLLEVEAGLLESAVAHRNAPSARVDPAVSNLILALHSLLSDEQRAMVTRLVSSGAGMEIVVGKAGAGKTTALSLTRTVFETAGFSVSGTALSARAAEELESSAGIHSATLARFLGEIEDGNRHLGSRDIVVVDEAGMVGTRDIARLVDLARDSGAKLILVGDPRQLPEINAGGAFGALAVRLGATELTENRRQCELWERHALDQLRAGDATNALFAYEAHGRIHMSVTMGEAQSAMVGRWLAARDGGAETLMLAVNRTDVDALNDLARLELRSRGELGSDIMVTEDRSFARGDDVICLRNAKRLGVMNGTRGTVVGSDESGLCIDTGAGPRVLPLKYLAAGHLGHGYATTVHKSQGATYDRAFVLASESLTREAGYVAMSRARRSNELFVLSAPFEHGHGPDVVTDEPLARTATRLATSRAKYLASSHAAAELSSDIEPRRPEFREMHRESEQGEMEPLTAPKAPVLRARASDFWAIDASAAAQPDHLVAALGPRPMSTDEQEPYDKVAAAISDYRTQYSVEGDDPLGERPFESSARLAYDDVAGQICSFEHCRWLELEPLTLDLGLEL